MTLSRIKFVVLGLLAGLLITVGPAWLGYQSARGGGVPFAVLAEAGADPSALDAAPTTEPAPVLEQLADLRGKYEALKSQKDKDARMLAWAALIAGALKVLLSVVNRVWSKPKKWTAWIAMGLAVPIALLSHFAAGNGWFESLVYAGAGPGAIVVHELLKLFPARKAKMLSPTTVALILCASVAGCGWMTGKTKRAVGSVVDCGTAKAKDAIKQFAPTLEHAVVNTVDAAGRADWNTIEAITKDYAADVGGCVLQSVVTRLLDPVVNPDAPANSPLLIDKADLDNRWAALRATRYGGVMFKGAQ